MQPTNIAEDICVGILPGLVVFDLDFTVWPFDCHKDRAMPFTRNETNVYDYRGRIANCYPDIPSIIGFLVDNNIPVAYASRNPSLNHIIELLKISVIQTKKGKTTLWDILPNHNYLQAYSSGFYGYAKNHHFNRLHVVTGVEFNKMLFFDDLPQNIEQARTKGITSIQLAKDGVTMELFTMGLSLYNDSHKPVEPLVTNITTSLPEPLVADITTSLLKPLVSDDPLLTKSPISLCLNIESFIAFDFDNFEHPNKRCRYELSSSVC